MINSSFTADLYLLFLREMAGDKTAYEAIQKAFSLRSPEELSRFVENTRDLHSVASAIFREYLVKQGHNAAHVWGSELYAEMGRAWEVKDDGKILKRHLNEEDIAEGSGFGEYSPVLINDKFPRTDCGGLTVIYWMDNMCNLREHCRYASVLSTDLEIK